MIDANEVQVLNLCMRCRVMGVEVSCWMCGGQTVADARVGITRGRWRYEPGRTVVTSPAGRYFMVPASWTSPPYIDPDVAYVG